MARVYDIETAVRRHERFALRAQRREKFLYFPRIGKNAFFRRPLYVHASPLAEPIVCAPGSSSS
jgi:hypothetical protein